MRSQRKLPSHLIIMISNSLRVQKFDFVCNENDYSKGSKFNVRNLYFPPEFSIDKGKLSNSFVWLLKYVSYFRKSKIKVKKLISTTGIDWDTYPLIITDEDFASLSVGKDLNIPRILITDILRTHFIKNGVLSNIEKYLNNSMCNLIKSSDCVIIPESGKIAIICFMWVR